MNAAARLEYLQAEQTYYRERISLLRARLYGRGEATSRRLRELERGLEQADRALVRARSGAAAAPPGDSPATDAELLTDAERR